MFLPVIIYNYYLLIADRVILATMFLLFIIMLMIVAKLNKDLVNKSFILAEQQKLLIDKLEVISITDSLTGLYNRRHFVTILQKEFDRAKRNKYPLNLVSIDIDNFKLVNDNLGHPYGDKFLIYTAELLKKTFRRSNDTVFRLGGDEFASIIANQSMQDVEFLCKMIREEFKKIGQACDPIVSNNHAIFEKVTLSIGIAHISFNYLSDIESVSLAADQALYQAKKQGKNKIISSDLH